eukprot:3221544-Rhodomonas_salina.1
MAAVLAVLLPTCIDNNVVHQQQKQERASTTTITCIHNNANVHFRQATALKHPELYLEGIQELHFNLRVLAKVPRPDRP